MELRILVRGGGDLASGVIFRCARAGWEVFVTELEQPLAVRRKVSFSQAVYDGIIEIEGLKAERADSYRQAEDIIKLGKIPVLVDPSCESRHELRPDIIIDARMTKRPPELPFPSAVFMIGLGPGFSAGVNCQAVIETIRGPFLGRVIWDGSAELNTGVPDTVGAYRDERVLRSPDDGRIFAIAQIGDQLKPGQLVALVAGKSIYSPFEGVLRGLIQDGLYVSKGMKVGDVDPRNDPRLCRLVSEKALAVGGGVLEAILSWNNLRGIR
jgi:xanthine dehydrogenase accessory factor